MTAPTKPLPIERVADGIASLKVSTDASPFIEDEAFVPALGAAVEALAADTAVRVVLVEGGTRYFSAGARLELLERGMGRAESRAAVASVPRHLLSLPVPSIAVMSGHATGGGFVMGLWCDLAVLAEESLYGANFMALGVTPGMGSTVLLAETFGEPLAHELLYTGRLVKGRELRERGHAGGPMVLPRSEVRTKALALAEEIASAPRDALVLLKRTLSAQRLEALDRALERELADWATLFSNPDAVRRIRERYGAGGGMAGPAEVAP